MAWLEKFAKRETLFLLIVLVVLSLFLQTRSTNIHDADSFYHIRHAWIYRTGNLFDSSFPWAQYSVIRELGADLWYGFHFITIPLTWFQDLVFGIRAGSFLITIIVSLLFFYSLRRLNVRWPSVWIIFFLLASADVLYRMAMFRPHSISFGLGFFIFALLFSLRDNWKDYFLLFFASFFLSWLHAALLWFPLLVVAIAAFIKIFFQRSFQWKHLGIVLAGLLFGLLLRPHPINGLILLSIQVVRLLVEQSKGTPLSFGVELKPFTGGEFMDQFIPITIFFIAALIGAFLLLRSGKRVSAKKANVWILPQVSRALLFATALLGIIFFWLSFWKARRAVEFFIAFAVLLIALVFTWCREKFKCEGRSISAVSLAIGGTLAGILIIVVIISSLWRYGRYMDQAYRSDSFQGAMTWLVSHSQPGEIVFHTNWDQFGPLFFWNQHNFFISGMDPIFLYAYNPGLYWKMHFYGKDEASEFTCGAVRCTQEEVEKTFDVLRKDFNASYMIVRKKRNPSLASYLASASQDFTNVFEDDYDIIYQLRSH